MPLSMLAPARATRRLGMLAATLIAGALVASGLVVTVSPAAASTTIGGDSAQIVVKTGGLRTGLANNEIGPLDGVHLELWSGNNSPTSKINQPWADCYSVAGECVFTVPNNQVGGNTRFWIKQGASQSGSPAAQNYSANPNVVTALDNTAFEVSAYQVRTNSIAPGTRYVSGVDFMTLSDGNARDVSSGFWQNSYNNPPAQSKCGLNIALLADLSSSVDADALEDLKAAANAFVTALTGTPSTISLYTFGTTAPQSGANNSTLANQSALNAAQMTALKNKINGLSVPGGSYTNWDAGLWQLRNGAFDQVIVITDGNPTAYGVSTSTSGVDTRFNEIERAIFSANVLKSQGTRIVTVGVGSNFKGGENLKAMAGPVANSDYFTGDWASLSATLSKIAAANCGGTVTVVKKVIPWQGTIATAVPAGGWTINAAVPAGVSVDQSSAVTAAGNGAVNFKLSNVPVAGTTFTGTEVQQSGHKIAPQSSKNAVCTKTGGASVTVTNSGALGFTVPVGASDIVTCTVYNEAPQPNATVTVNKQWVVNGVALPLNEFPTGYDATLTGTATSWGVAKQIPIGTVSVGESDLTVPSEYCTLDSRKVTAFNQTVLNVNIASTSYTSPSLVADSTNTITVTNAVTCTSKLKLVKTVVNDNGGTATSANWTLKFGATGVTSGTTSVVTPGAYVLTEVGLAGSAGYAPSASNPLSCTTGLSGTTVTVPVATTVTCTFVNDDIAPTLQLEKVVTGAPGVGPENWTLTAKDGGSTVLTGNGAATGTVKANVPFALTEASAPGFTLGDQFTASAWECQTNGAGPWTALAGGALPALALDADVHCRITNTAIGATPTVAKDVASNTANADGTWTTVYTVTVTNPSKLAELTYDLNDTLDFGTGITTSASASGPSPQAGSWTGAGPLAQGVSLPKDSKHVYTVTVISTLPAGISPSELVCPTGAGDGGFMNRVVLTVAGKTYPDDACARPAVPTFTKSPSATAPVSNPDGTWTIGYDLEVKNPSNQQLFYSLSDTPNLPAGVSLVSSKVTGPVTATGTIPGVLFSGAAIAGGATHKFVVTLTVEVDSTVPVGDLACTAGKGLDNDAVVTSSNQAIADDACVSITPPTVVHDKTVTSTQQNADGTWTVVYDVAVTNPGAVNGVYSLIDAPKVSVPGALALVLAKATGPTSQAGTWDGVGSTALAVDQPIVAGATQHFTVTVVALVSANAVSTPAARCVADNGTNGFLNTTVLTASGVETSDSACSSPSQPDLVKDFVGAEPTGPGTWSVSYTITVSNTDPGAKPAYYTLSDTLGFPSGVTTSTPVVTLTSADPDVDVPWNDGGLVPAPRQLAAGGTDTYLVVVPATVPVGTGSLTCTNEPGNGFYNSASVVTGADTLVSADCGPVDESVVPTIVKDLAPGYPMQQADGTWLIKYTVTVANPSTTLAAKYSLSDELAFGGGILISKSPAATITGPVDTNPAWTGLGVTSVVSDVTLPKNSQHVYTVTVTATVPDGTYDTNAACLESKEDGGFLNVATITSGPVTRSDDACAQPGRPSIAKVVDPGNAPKLVDGKWLVSYLLTVTNDTDYQVAYDLTDEFDMAPGLALSGAKVTSEDASVDPKWDGTVDTTVTNGTQVLGAVSQDVFSVSVLVEVENDYDVEDECSGKPGEGLFNAAVLSSLGVAYDDADACAELPVAELTLVKIVDNSAFEGLDRDGHTLADVDDWTLSADGEDASITGTSGAPEVTTVLVPAGTYELDEAVAKDAGSDLLDYYTAGQWSCDDVAGDSVQLADGDSVVCEIVNTGHPVDLSIVKDDSGVVIDEGETYEYTFRVANNEKIGAKDTVVTDVIPSTLKVTLPFVSVPANWTVELEGEDSDGFGGTLILTRSGVFAGDSSAEFVFEVTAAAELPREGDSAAGKILDIVNTATVGSSGIELTPDNNTDTEKTPVTSIGLTVTGICTKNAPYASWSITPFNTESIVDQQMVIIWWTPEAFAARDTSIPASETAAILADGAVKVAPIPTPSGGWTTGETTAGTSLWAGGSVDKSGVGNGWPGWKLVGEKWVQDPSSPFYPVRAGAIVEIRMNPYNDSSITYPTGVFCGPLELPTFPLPTPLTELAFTGAVGFGGVLLVANVIAAAGILMVAYRRKPGAHRA